MVKTWVLSVLHWLFGGIFTFIGIFELLKINFSALYAWFELIIGVTIIVLGFAIAKNIFKPSEGSLSNLI